MLETFAKSCLARLGADELSDALERGAIAYFSASPVPLPAADDVNCRLPELAPINILRQAARAG